MAKLAYTLQGHTDVQGIHVSIENRKGSIRKGKNSDGSEWRTKFKHPYGYLRGTVAGDGDAVDAYVGPDKEAPNAFVVHQHKDNGKGFDEDKVMLGFKTKSDATKAFLEHYDSKKFLGPVSTVPVERLRKMVKEKKVLTKIAGTDDAAPKDMGFYKGEPSSPHTVKFKTEFQGIPINVDRPKGFIMKGTDPKGNDWARRYKYDYGFIPKTLGGDDDGLDVFIGPVKKHPYAYWAVQRKPDGSFDEYKVFLGFPDRDAAISAYRQHIPKKLFNGIMTMKVEMMKAMLGKVNPDEKIKRAAVSGFFEEMQWLLKTAASVEDFVDLPHSASQEEVAKTLRQLNRASFRQRLLNLPSRLMREEGR